jgi:hypothetical protein
MAAGVRAQVLIVLSDDTTSYQQVAGAFRTEFAKDRRSAVRVDIVTAQSLAGAGGRSLNDYELVMTVGLAAARAIVAREPAVSRGPATLCLLIPRQGYEALVHDRREGRERRISAIYLDQPLSRQLDLIRIALPERRRIGAMLGPISGDLRIEIGERARERELAFSSVDVVSSSAVYGALQQLLPESDVLLALPDPVAFNASTAYGLLLTTYRAGVPVMGFSDALVKAGALLGLFSTAAQLGSQGAEIAARVYGGDGPMPPPQYPAYFTVKANYSVARSLGIALDDESRLATALAQREARRAVPAYPITPSGNAR